MLLSLAVPRQLAALHSRKRHLSGLGIGSNLFVSTRQFLLRSITMLFVCFLVIFDDIAFCLRLTQQKLAS